MTCVSIPFTLASSSPARLAALQAAGVEPWVRVSGIDEDAVVAAAVADGHDLGPADIALLLARSKADDVVGALEDEGAGSLVLGCDSVLELDGAVHGKPADAAQAVQRWQQMRGRSGILHTGHWLVDARDEDEGGTLGVAGATASTVVHFAQLTDEEIEAYVATGEPLRVAGAFTIDGLGGPFVTGVEGDPGTVVGLSLPLLRDLLLELGVGWFDVSTP